MEQKFTLNETKKNSSIMNSKKERTLTPSVHTLSFIRQFACSYHVENSLPISLCGMSLN
jgi:hypothetical protein